MSQFKGSQAGRILSYLGKSQSFCSVQTFSWLDEAHPISTDSNVDFIQKHPHKNTWNSVHQIPGHLVATPDLLGKITLPSPFLVLVDNYILPVCLEPETWVTLDSVPPLTSHIQPIRKSCLPSKQIQNLTTACQFHRYYPNLSHCHCLWCTVGNTILKIAATRFLALLCSHFIHKYVAPFTDHVISLFMLVVVFLSASGGWPRTVPDIQAIDVGWMHCHCRDEESRLKGSKNLPKRHSS